MASYSSYSDLKSNRNISVSKIKDLPLELEEAFGSDYSFCLDRSNRIKMLQWPTKSNDQTKSILFYNKLKENWQSIWEGDETETILQSNDKVGTFIKALPTNDNSCIWTQSELELLSLCLRRIGLIPYSCCHIKLRGSNKGDCCCRNTNGTTYCSLH